jgi:hypothetical protein
LQQRDDVEGDGAEAPQRLLPLRQLRWVRRRPAWPLLPPPEQRPAHRGVLGRGARVHEGVVVVLLREGGPCRQERVAGGRVLAGAVAEERAVRLGGGGGVAGVGEEEHGAGGIGGGGGDGDGTQARDVGGGAGGVGGEGGNADVVEAGGVARRLQQRGLVTLLAATVLWLCEGDGGVGEVEDDVQLDKEQDKQGGSRSSHCRRSRMPVSPLGDGRLRKSPGGEDIRNACPCALPAPCNLHIDKTLKRSRLLYMVVACFTCKCNHLARSDLSGRPASKQH